MDPTVGQRLRSARGRRGLAVQDVCHETRISLKVIRALEEDDYSSFSNVTYAKSFLSMYADYLDEDVSDILPQFVTHVAYESFQPHFSESAEGHTSRLRPKKDPARQRTAPVALFLMLLALVAAVPTVYYVAKEADTDLTGSLGAKESDSSAPALSDDSSSPDRVEANGGASLPSSSAFSPDPASITLVDGGDLEEPSILPARRFTTPPAATGGSGGATPSFRSTPDRRVVDESGVSAR